MNHTIRSPRKQRTHRSHTKKKTAYKITNWHVYNEALTKRGSIELWIDSGIIAKWHEPPHFTRGRQKKYSDLAIVTALTLKQVYRLPLRQTRGLLRSIVTFMGEEISIPAPSTLSRRQGALAVSVCVRTTANRIELFADSTGGKVSGEGEWKVRKHGVGKRREWIKIHLGLTPSGDILSCAVTKNDVHDAEVIGELLNVGDGVTIDAFGGDGAYDKRSVYAALQKQKVRDIRIPPQKNARIWKHGNRTGPPHPRDENLRAIRRSSRATWKRESGYHVRSNAETAMFRFKTAFGDRIASRVFRNQRTEVHIKVRALNIMAMCGMPESVLV